MAASNQKAAHFKNRSVLVSKYGVIKAHKHVVYTCLSACKAVLAVCIKTELHILFDHGLKSKETSSCINSLQNASMSSLFAHYLFRENFAQTFQVCNSRLAEKRVAS